MFFCTTDSESFSKADILRGIITEKLSIATRDILAVVERTVADYEEEASGFRRRIARQERQLELLQPRVRLRRPLLEPEPRGYEELAVQEPPKEELLPPPRVGTKKKKTVFLGVEDSVRLHFPKKNDDEDDDDGAGAFDDEASDEEEQLAEQVQPSASSREKSKDPDFELPRRPQRRPVRPSRARTRSGPTHLNLRIRFIQDPNVDLLHRCVLQNTIVRDLSFPQSLQESEFVDLIRSSFPLLAESDKDFEIHTLNHSKRLIKLPLKTMAPREIVRSMKSNAPRATVLFIKLKRPEAEKKSEETSEEKLKGTSEEIKEKSEEKEEKPEEDNEEMEDSHVSTVEDTPSSSDAVPEEEDVAGPSSRPQRHPVRPIRYWTSSSPTHLNLRIRFIKDPNVDMLHSSVVKKTIVRDLSFPQSLQESEFVDLIRSSFPPLTESDKDFEIHTLNGSQRLIKLPLKTMSPREIIRSMKSNAPRATVLFIKLKRPEAEKKSEETSEEKLKGASEEVKEKSEEEKEEKPEEDNEEMEDSHVSTVEDTPSSTDAVPEEEDVAGPSSRPQRHPVRPIRYWTSSSPTHLNLRIRFIKDPNVDMLHSSVLQNTIVRDLSFPQSLQESEFVDLIRSSFPPLAESDKDFEIHTLNRSKRLIKLPVKTLSPREIVRSMKSNARQATVLFIKLKRPEAEKKSEETSEEKLKGTSEEIKEKSEEEKEEKPEEDNEEMEDSHVSTVEDTPSSTDAVPEEEDVAGPSSSSGPHGFREEAGSKDSPEPQRDSEVDDVDQDDASAEDPEWKLESKQQIEVKKTADKTSKSLGERWKKRACKVCGFLYKSRGSLIKHTWTHMDEPQRVCGVCGDTFESPDELKEHLRTYDKVHKCEECGKTFVNIYVFKSHLDLHSRKVDIQCDVCGKKFGTKSGLSVHSWSHIEERPYKCDICDKAFGLKSLLKAHRRSHDENQQCHICGKTLSSTRALSRHLTIHSEKRNFACDVCGKRFKMPYSLKCHKKIHMDRERSFLCHICCKTFHCNRALNSHMITHSSEKPEKPFVCQDCGKGFVIQAHLKNHQRVHTGERPFSCSHCGRCFKLKSTLKIHINTHLGIKRFTCTLCGKTASQLEHLKVHMRTHNGDKPYKCSLCDKAFTQSHCLKTHMMKFHPGENPSQNPTGP
ncbi:uncharacterized protein LOC105353778 isoform X1 [Oryzias latipes]